MSNIGIKMAKMMHKNWVSTLKLAFKGQASVNETELYSYENCEFGKWIYSEGVVEYGDQVSMRLMEKIHVQLHRDVRKMFAYEKEGNVHGRDKMMRKIELTSQEMMKLLVELEEANK